MIIGLRVLAFPGKIPVALIEYTLPYTVAGTAPDLLPDGYSAPGSLLSFSLWRMSTKLTTFSYRGLLPSR